MINDIISNNDTDRNYNKNHNNNIILKKAGLSRIKITSTVPKFKGELRWLLTPRILKKYPSLYKLYQEKNMKASVIDLGYNSIKLVNYNIIQKNNNYRPYYDKSIRVKLGEDMHITNLLKPDAMDGTYRMYQIF